jgi:hypothetical protein
VTAPPSLSIIIATRGRPHLAITAATTASQLDHGDELLIQRLDCAWGAEARRHAIPRAAGTHLMFIDDDDVHTTDALDIVRSALDKDPDHAHFFAMRYLDDGRTLTPTWPLRCGYIATPMFVVPNDPATLGVWTDRYEGDYDFIHSTMVRRDDEPRLHEDVIALIGTPNHARLEPVA